MSVLAALRPDDWNFVLFVHIAGAMALVGALVLAATSLGSENPRLGFRALVVAIPSWIVMRIGAQFVLDKEGLADADPAPTWVDIGFMTSEGSFVLLIAATVCAGLAASRGRAGLARAALVLVSISLLAYLVAIWAMTTKPS